MQRYTVISADCHAGATDSRGGFMDYVDPAYRDRLREHTEEKRRDARVAYLTGAELTRRCWDALDGATW